ncbi:MAG: DUF3105 domain-containing protein [Kofleriaceae bacterium]
MRRAWCALIAVATWSCGDNLAAPARPDAGEVDAGEVDAGEVDAGEVDAGEVDAGEVDAGEVDAGALDAPGDAATDGPTAADAAPPGDAATDAPGCTTTEVAPPLAAGVHVAQCTPIAWATNPPTSGPHYPLWARFKTYATRVPRGFWVHGLEHGAVVLAYNCPAGCAAEVAALTAYLAARPADPLCTAAVRNRFIVTPDPALPTRFAAVAWGHALTGDCLDLDAVGRFIDAHYAQAPENVCADGFDPTDPGNGVPADCP